LQRPLRLVIFEPFGNLYGSEQSILDLLGGLSFKDVVPVVYCPRGAAWVPHLRALGIRYVDWFELDLHKKGRLARIVALFRFMAFLKMTGADLIHVNQAGAAPYALLAGRLLRLPVVFHSRWHEDANSIKSWRHCEALARIVCISDYQQRLIESKVRFGTGKLVMIRNPYRLRSERIEKPTPRQSTPLFVCPARLHPHKRQDLLIAATQVYIDRYGPCTVWLLGEESQGAGYAASLRVAVEKFGLEESVAFCGYQDAIRVHLAQAAAMVLPSETESLGRVVFEAWDAGTVPIAWRGSGGPSETIASAAAGILYSEQTAEALADAMQQAATLSSADREALIGNGLAWLRENCTPERHAEAMLRIWHSAMARA
jgi:glycosyltransferase involved in cell wall biosynthesis